MCVVGAGVIGSLYAAHLSRVADVWVLTRRSEHARALAAEGLTVSGRADWQNLTPGTYTIEENPVPTGYALTTPPNLRSFTVQSGQELVWRPAEDLVIPLLAYIRWSTSSSAPSAVTASSGSRARPQELVIAKPSPCSDRATAAVSRTASPSVELH